MLGMGRVLPCAKNTRSNSAHTYIHPTQLTLLEHRFQPTPPLAGQEGPIALFFMHPGEYILT